MFQPGEFEELVGLVKSVDPKIMVEIGCHSGRTAKAMLNRVPSLQEYIGIDVEPDYEPALEEQKREILKNPGHQAVGDPRFKLMVRPMGSFDIKPKDIGLVDVVFIDGDHGREAVANDSELALCIIKAYGIIIWHDYDNPRAQVSEVLNRLRDVGGRNIRHIEGTWLAYERF